MPKKTEEQMANAVRLSYVCSKKEKELMEEAAEYYGLATISSFVRKAAQEKLERYEKIKYYSTVKEGLSKDSLTEQELSVKRIKGYLQDSIFAIQGLINLLECEG